MSSKNLVDYIVVGGGAAGSVLAHRLGENPQNRVLVIEAGGPSRLAQAPTGPRFRGRRAPQGLGERRVGRWNTDRLAGASTKESGTIRSRGGQADYETWEAVGVTGWNWDRLLGAFTAMQRHAAGATGLHHDDSRPSAEAVGPPDVACSPPPVSISSRPTRPWAAILRQRRGAAFTLWPNGVPEHGPEPLTPTARLRARVRRALRRPDTPKREDISVATVLNSDRGMSPPDMELLFTPSPVAGATVAFVPQLPTSVGTVHISGPSLDDPPRLVPGYLSTDHDEELTVAACARAREVLATEPFPSAMTEAFPGTDVAEPADVLRYVREHGFTEQAAGTCALGPGGGVDDELRVRRHSG